METWSGPDHGARPGNDTSGGGEGQTDSGDLNTNDIRVVPMEVFISACVLCAIGYLIATVFLVFNVKYRTTRIVKMSSPNVNVLLALGAYLAYVCCILSSLGALIRPPKSLVAPCQVLTWVLPVSVTFTFGTMVTKSWRVRRIFINAPQKKVVIRDHILFAIVLALLVIDILILSMWQAFDPLHSRIVTESIEYRPPTGDAVEHTLRICQSRHSSKWIMGLFAYKVLIVLYGVYLSWAVRAVTLPAMNDSTAIILSSLLTVLAASAAAVLTVWFRHYPEVTSACLVVTVWLCTTVTLCLNFIPKMRLLWKNSEEEIMKISVASQIIYSPNQSIDQVEDEIYHLVGENRSLKKSLAQKEQTIKSLQEHVTSAKEKLGRLFLEEKQDSGLDLDMSSSSNHGDDQDRVDQVIATDACQSDDVIDGGNAPSARTGAKYRPNSRQLSGVTVGLRGSLNRTWARAPRRAMESEDAGHVPGTLDQYQRSRLRDSLGDIAHELRTVDHISNTLCNSFHQDLARARTRSSLVYEHVRATQELTGSIVDSYDLDDQSDTYSYVSNHLMTVHAHAPYTYSNGGYHQDAESSMGATNRSSSNESLSTLGNDRYYPSAIHGKFTKKTKRSKRFGRRNSWKREARPKIYSVFGPKPAEITTAPRAGVRMLYDEGTYV